MSQEYKDIDLQLELKDRLPYQLILQKKLEKLSEFISNSDRPSKDIQSGILDFLTDIPDSWKDEAFENEMKKVINEKIIDIRPIYAGSKLSIEYCKKHGIPLTKKIRTINYFSLKNAIINLLDRLNLLIRKEKIEYSTGRNLDIKTLEDLDKILDEVPDEEEKKEG